MLTSWDQVHDWIKDNGLKRWIFYKEKPSGDNKQKIIDSSAFSVSDEADKLGMSEKYLRISGGRAYAVGYGSANGEIIADIRLEDNAPSGQQTVAVGGYPDINELRNTITKQIRAEIKAEQYEEDRKRFEQEKKAFEAEKQSGMGALLHLLAPVGQAILGKRAPMMSGVDTETPTQAQPIEPIETEEMGHEPEEKSVYDEFTDEEGEEIFTLMARFRKVEPDNWMKMLRKMVSMAESQDMTYQMAKNFLTA